MKKQITLRLYKNNKLENEYQNIKCLYNNSYIFVIDMVKTTIDETKFIRENDEFKFYLDIKNKQATYLLKEQNMLFDIEVEKISYKNENDIIILEYRISSDESNIKIKIEVKGDLDE